MKTIIELIARCIVTAINYVFSFASIVPFMTINYTPSVVVTIGCIVLFIFATSNAIRQKARVKTILASIRASKSAVTVSGISA